MHTPLAIFDFVGVGIVTLFLLRKIARSSNARGWNEDEEQRRVTLESKPDIDAIKKWLKEMAE